MFDDVQDGWRRTLASGDVEQYRKFLKDMNLNDRDNPLKTTVLEHGFIPESDGMAAVDLERRIMNSLPHIAYMVSRPRQEANLSERMFPRYDAAPRPYWLRDWQQGFGGFTKVCECVVDEEVRRVYFVAYVIRPRTKDENACLCSTLMSKVPSKKPWKRGPDVRDPSRSVILDLQSNSEWSMQSTVEPKFLKLVETLDDMQVQCLPVAKSKDP